jgi:phosphoglycolate phosphatase
MKSIVFDLDGTLVDSVADIYVASCKMLSDEGISPLPADLVTSFTGNGAPMLVARIAAHEGFSQSDHPRLTTAFLAHYHAAPAVLTRPYEGVFNLLEKLKADGFRMAICTNKPHDLTRKILAKLAIEGYFDAVVGGDSLAQNKPNPAPLLHAFDALSATEMLYVGDSEIDAETAQRAGVAFALFTAGYRKGAVADIAHDYSFDAFDDLAQIVAAHFKAAG